MDENADQSFYIPPENRKRSGVPRMLPPFVWLTVIFLVGVILGNILWLFTADVLAFGREENEIQITISDTDTLKDISKKLKNEGLVNYAWLFRLYAKLTNAEARIRPGTYTLSTHYDYHALVKVLSAGNVSKTLQFIKNPKEIEI